MPNSWQKVFGQYLRIGFEIDSAESGSVVMKTAITWEGWPDAPHRKVQDTHRCGGDKITEIIVEIDFSIFMKRVTRSDCGACWQFIWVLLANQNLFKLNFKSYRAIPVIHLMKDWCAICKEVERGEQLLRMGKEGKKKTTSFQQQSQRKDFTCRGTVLGESQSVAETRGGERRVNINISDHHQRLHAPFHNKQYILRKRVNVVCNHPSYQQLLLSPIDQNNIPQVELQISHFYLPICQTLD